MKRVGVGAEAQDTPCEERDAGVRHVVLAYGEAQTSAPLMVRFVDGATVQRADQAYGRRLPRRW